jgi:adenylylsulfate kinase
MADRCHELSVEAGTLVWLTGLSGAGKTTIGRGITANLLDQGLQVLFLDGDEFRAQYCHDLGFTIEDRRENIRRIIKAAETAVRSGAIVIVATISPLESMRVDARNAVPRFLEVFVDAPVAVCEQRDPKGLYRKVREGLLFQFTGVDAPYEVPLKPDVICSTAIETVDQSVGKICSSLISKSGVLK